MEKIKYLKPHSKKYDVTRGVYVESESEYSEGFLHSFVEINSKLYALIFNDVGRIEKIYYKDIILLNEI